MGGVNILRFAQIRTVAHALALKSIKVGGVRVCGLGYDHHVPEVLQKKLAPIYDSETSHNGLSEIQTPSIQQTHASWHRSLFPHTIFILIEQMIKK